MTKFPRAWTLSVTIFALFAATPFSTCNSFANSLDIGSGTGSGSGSDSGGGSGGNAGGNDGGAGDDSGGGEDDPREKRADHICTEPGEGMQMNDYCQEMANARRAARRQQTLGTLHAIVFGVCGVACAGATQVEPACAAGSIAASAISLAMTIDTGNDGDSSLTNVLIPLTSQRRNFSLLKNWDYSQGADNEDSEGACTTMLIEGISSAANYEGASNSRDTADDMEENIVDLARTDTAVVAPSLAGNAATAVSSDPSSGGRSSDGSLHSGENRSFQFDRCFENVGRLVACGEAAGAGADLRKLASEDFKKAFQESSGQDIDSFIRSAENSDNSTSLLARASRNGGDTAADAILESNRILAKLKGHKKQQQTSRYLASGSASKNEKKKKGSSDLLKKMMADLDPQKESQKKESVNEIRFQQSAADKAPGENASLFKRVTYRYQISRSEGRLPQLPWSSPINRGLARSSVPGVPRSTK